MHPFESGMSSIVGNYGENQPEMRYHQNHLENTISRFLARREQEKQENDKTLKQFYGVRLIDQFAHDQHLVDML